MNRSQLAGALGVQAALWSVGSALPTAEAFRSVTDKSRYKPRGGMWTSTYLGAEELSGWAQWCRGERWGCDDADLWLLTPEPDAPVYVIDTYDDLAYLHHCYGRTENHVPNFDSHYIDWTLVAEQYAAVNLTDEGQWRTRMTMPYDLYGWDCESTLWMRWAFMKAEHGGIVTVNASALDQAVTSDAQ